MEQYEKHTINALATLKRPTIYFYLKENNFSEHHIKALRKHPLSFKLNGQICPINTHLTNGDLLEILKNPSQGSTIAPCEGNLDILFEDEHFLIVNKPHLLACIPTRSHYQNNLGGQIMNYMKEKDPHFVLRVINRLDKDTAGIVVVAKSNTAQNELKNLDKTYYALCNGNFEKRQFTIDAPILTKCNEGINQMKRVVSAEGKRAVTHVFVEKNFQSHALAKIKLETGRTHQIRVHLSNLGHSLVGDPIYGDHLGTETHTFLILKEVSFVHPQTKKQINLTVPFPDEWKNFLI